MADLDKQLSEASAALELAKASHDDGSPEHKAAREKLRQISHEIGVQRPPMGSGSRWKKITDSQALRLQFEKMEIGLLEAPLLKLWGGG